MEVGDSSAFRVRNFVQIASHVALRIGVVDFGDGMQWLMNVTSIVDDHSKDERASVFVIGEVEGDAGNVLRRIRVFIAFKERGEIGQSMGDVNICLVEVEVIEGGALLVKVGLINEMPVVLEGAKGQLDVIREGCAFRERVIFLIYNHLRVSLLQVFQFGDGLFKNLGRLLAQNLLGLSGD